LEAEKEMAAGKSGWKWYKVGKTGSDPVAPGSFGGYLKPRERPSAYTTLPQQKKVGSAGRKMVACKGKKGGEFRKCRHNIMAEIFGFAKVE